MDSILTSVKKMLGLTEEYEAYDLDIIILINATLALLNRIGIGKQSYRITDKSNTWDEFLVDSEGNVRDDLEDAKAYVPLKVKMMFDTSTMSGTQKAAIDEQLRELEWSLSIKEEEPIDMDGTYVTVDEVEEMINSATKDLTTKTYVDDMVEQVISGDKVRTIEDFKNIHSSLDSIKNDEDVNDATDKDTVDDSVIEELLDSMYK